MYTNHLLYYLFYGEKKPSPKWHCLQDALYAETKGKDQKGYDVIERQEIEEKHDLIGC